MSRRAILLVARREVRERARSKVFLASTAVLVLLVAGSTALQGALSKQPTFRYGVPAPAPAGLLPALERAARPFDARARLRVVATPADGRRALETKQVDALVLLPSDRIVFRAKVDTRVAAVADAAVRAVRNHFPPAPELAASVVHPQTARQADDARILVAYAGSLLLLMSLAVYGQWVVGGVIEERNSRVVELVLSAVRPAELLAGKVIGIGLLALSQLVLVAGLAAALLALGVFDAPASLAGSVALIVPWFVLGFALYAVAYATAGALASRQQNADVAGQPVSYALVAAYFAGYAAVAADSDGLAAHLLTVFPLTAPLVLPARSALVGVAVWEQALAAVLVLASTYALVRLAGRVYARGLLHSGPRLRLRHLLREWGAPGA